MLVSGASLNQLLVMIDDQQRMLVVFITGSVMGIGLAFFRFIQLIVKSKIDGPPTWAMEKARNIRDAHK